MLNGKAEFTIAVSIRNIRVHIHTDVQLPLIGMSRALAVGVVRADRPAARAARIHQVTSTAIASAGYRSSRGTQRELQSVTGARWIVRYVLGSGGTVVSPGCKHVTASTRRVGLRTCQLRSVEVGTSSVAGRPGSGAGPMCLPGHPRI